jgi:hypothetical protein
MVENPIPQQVTHDEVLDRAENRDMDATANCRKLLSPRETPTTDNGLCIKDCWECALSVIL